MGVHKAKWEVYELDPPPFGTSAENPGTLDLSLYQHLRTKLDCSFNTAPIPDFFFRSCNATSNVKHFNLREPKNGYLPRVPVWQAAVWPQALQLIPTHIATGLRRVGDLTAQLTGIQIS